MHIYDATGNGLFNLLGACAGLMGATNRARSATIPDRVSVLVTAFAATDLDGLEKLSALEDVQSTVDGWIDAGDDLGDQMRAVAETVLVSWAASQAEQADTEVQTALQFLIEAMKIGGVYVTSSTVTAAVAADVANLGDVELLVSVRRGDGKLCQHALSETISVELTSESAAAPTLTVTAGEAADDRLSHTWPAGSGANTTLSGNLPSDGYLTAGDFATWVDDLPSGWLLETGSRGGTVRQSRPSAHRVVISGTPTSGGYYLVYTDRLGHRRMTSTLSYSDSASTVESALQALSGLEAVTVDGSGDAPNYTFTITFAGTTAVDTLEVYSYLNTGTITATLLEAGDAGAWSGNSLRIDGAAYELTALYAPIATLLYDTVYFVHLWLSQTETIQETSSSSRSGTSTSISSASTSTEVFLTSTTTSNSSSSTLFGQNDMGGFIKREITRVEAEAIVAARGEPQYEPREPASYSSSGSSTQSLTSVSSSSSSTTSTSRSTTTSQSSATSLSTTSTSTSTSTSQTSTTSTEASLTSSSESSRYMYDLRVEIVDGIEGNVISDSANVANVLAIDGDALGGTPRGYGFSFRIPGSVTQPCYLRLRFASPLPSGYSVFVDDVTIVPGTELYAGGPWAAAFTGRDLGIAGDKWSIAVANDRRGRVHEWCERLFDLSGKSLLLPVAGQVLIPETVIPEA